METKILQTSFSFLVSEHLLKWQINHIKPIKPYQIISFSNKLIKYPYANGGRYMNCWKGQTWYMLYISVSTYGLWSIYLHPCDALMWWGDLVTKGYKGSGGQSWVYNKYTLFQRLRVSVWLKNKPSFIWLIKNFR